MSEWKEFKLGDVLAEKGYIRGPFGSALKRGEMKDSGIPVYEQKNAIYDSREFRFFIDDDKFQELSRFQVKTNDLIISCSGTVGRISIIKEEDTKGIISQALLILRPDINKIALRYLYYFLSSKQGFELITQASHGSVQVNIAERKVVESIPLSLPPLPEQRAIASVLSSLDDKIDLLHRQNKTLEAMAETLFRQWFVEKAEAGWEEGKLGDVANFNNGKSRPESIEGSTIPIYGGNGILGYTIRSNSEGMSIVIGRVGAYCGSLYIENRPIWITDNALSAKPKNKKYTSYLYYLLKSLYLNQMAEGSSHPLLTQTLLNTIDITISSDDIIAAFCGFADSILMKSFFNKHQIRTIKKLRDILLPKLMSGEVRVSL